MGLPLDCDSALVNAIHEEGRTAAQLLQASVHKRLQQTVPLVWVLVL